jgi:hypothetical protein
MTISRDIVTSAGESVDNHLVARFFNTLQPSSVSPTLSEPERIAQIEGR